MEDNVLVASNTTTPAADVVTNKSAGGTPPILSTVITICFLFAVVAGVYIIYRLVNRRRSNDDERVEKNSNGKKPEFFDQFNVNSSQLNIESEEEKKFINPAARISEPDSTSSNVSSERADRSGALGMLVKSIHSDARFTVRKSRDRSSRPSSLKLKVPRQFVSGDASEEESFSLALIDKRSNTIHNIDLSDCLFVDGQPDSASLTPNSAIFAQRWKEKTRQRKTRRTSLEVRRSAQDGRTRFLPRQASCPNALSAKGFRSGSLSSHSDDSTSGNNSMRKGASLSSIDESAHKSYDDGIFSQ